MCEWGGQFAAIYRGATANSVLQQPTRTQRGVCQCLPTGQLVQSDIVVTIIRRTCVLACLVNSLTIYIYTLIVYQTGCYSGQTRVSRNSPELLPSQEQPSER